LLIALFVYAIFIINRQKRLAELKNDFINNLTHEFNTPLFSIGITSNLLLISDTIHQSDKLKNYVELIAKEKNRIQLQVDKILRLTAIESGGVIIENELIDVHDIIRDSVQSFETVIRERDGTIKFNAGAARHFVKGDKVHIMNVLNNLLENASKYTDKAPGIIVDTNNSDDELLISIADNGIGITKADIERVFNKYYRVKDGDRHDVKGFGIGLSYVSRIIKLHKGSVEVKSKLGKGSVFIIRLPYYNNI
jgi:two-component system phosphate regulon sensor histidine kinase PhoR